MMNVQVNSVTFPDSSKAIISAPVSSHTTPPNVYRERQSFGGEKYDGALNYQTAYKLNYPALRLRSARAYDESPQAKAAINRLNEHIINTGLTLQSIPVANLLGISDEAAEEVSDRIEQRYSLWSESKNCDMSYNNTLGQIERIQFNNQLVKGDYFAYLHLSDDPRLINPLQIKIITPERVTTPFGTDLIRQAEARGNEIIDGVEISPTGEEVNYYVLTKRKGKRPEFAVFPRLGPDTGRIVTIHGNRQRFGDEVRGVPVLAHMAHELEKITDYSILEIASAIANASVAQVVESPESGGPSLNPYPPNMFIPPSLLDASDTPVTNEQNFENGYTNLGKSVFRNTGGLVVAGLNPGEKLKSFDTSRPNVNFAGFVDGMMKYLSASLNIPPEVLAMLFGQNYSASRGALILFWQSIAVWRSEFVSDFLTPIYESWLLGEVATGQLRLNGYDNPNMRAAWNKAKWIGVPAPSLDPLKEERAGEIRNRNGYSTHEYEAQSRHNTSFSANISRLTRENRQLAEANGILEGGENGD